MDLAATFISKVKTLADDQHKKRKTTLYQAVNNGDLKTVQAICQEATSGGFKLVSPEYRNEETNSSVLMHAFLEGKTEIVEYLISAGNQELLLDEQEVTIHGIKSKRNLLHYVASHGDVNLARKLLMNIKNSDERKAYLLKDTWIKSVGQRPRTHCSMEGSH